MDAAKLRAWWSAKQGLDGSLKGKKPEDVLQKCGWARSVGGANPYLTLFSRAGVRKADAERAAKESRIHELPSARGCTYVLPAADFTLGLTVSQGFGDAAAVNTAKKYLGFTDKELDRLCEKVMGSLGKEPMDPRQIKEAVGSAVRSFGEEGKKRGQTTSLPLALGKLQTSGLIRRVPVDGRLDNQRYGYVLWSPSPLAKSKMPQEEAFERLARAYWSWIGPASLAEFQWFSGLGVNAAKKAVAPLKLAPVEGTDLLVLPSELDALMKFKAPKEPQYALVADLDSIVLHRRALRSLVEDKDADLKAYSEKGARTLGTFSDLPHHAVLDRGRIVGLWEFDQPKQEIVVKPLVKPDAAFKKAVAATQDFVRELGDARGFSLDSPESRKPRIASLRKQAG